MNSNMNSKWVDFNVDFISESMPVNLCYTPGSKKSNINPYLVFVS